MDKPEDKQEKKSPAPKVEQKAAAKQGKSPGKALPDISKLSGARPTKIPRAVKKAEEIAAITTPKVDFKIVALGAAALFVLVGIVYANSIYGGLVFNDATQFGHLAQLQKTEGAGLELWAQALSKPLTQGWVALTMFWDLQSFRWNPGWSHVVNVFLHFFASLYLYLLVFRLAWRWRNDDRIKADPYVVALTVSGLFALHPLATGSVAYISARTGPLLALNYFLSLNLFVAGCLSENLWFAFFAYLLAITVNAAALMCNAQAITIPFTSVCLLLLLKPKADTWKHWLLNRGYELFLFGLLAAGLPFLLLTGARPTISNGAGLSALAPLSYYASQCKSLLTYYARGFFAPFGLTLDPPYTIAPNFSDPL
ncbi:MAG: hypothetical protein ACRD3W_21770, partial [Terriglobales bacterium]